MPSFKLILVGDGGTGALSLPPNQRSAGLSFPASGVRPRLWVVLTALLLPFFAGKTTFVKRHRTGEFEKKYERACCAACALDAPSLLLWKELEP